MNSATPPMRVLTITCIAILAVLILYLHYACARMRSSRLAARRPVSLADFVSEVGIGVPTVIVSAEIVRNAVATSLGVAPERVFAADQLAYDYRLPWAPLFLDDTDELIFANINEQLVKQAKPAWTSLDTKSITDVRDLTLALAEHLKQSSTSFAGESIA